MRSDTPRGRWFERAMREQVDVDMHTVMRICEIAELNPHDRDAGQLSDGELAFFAYMLRDPTATFMEGIRTGAIQIDPPGAKIIFKASELAKIGPMRDLVVDEIRRRIDLEP